MRKFDYGAGIVTGIVIGGLAVLIGGVFANDAGPAFLRSNAKELIQSIVTLLAAAWAWFAVMRQIAAQREAEERVKAAKLMAARAMLPLALSKLSDASEAGRQAFYEFYRRAINEWVQQHPNPVEGQYVWTDVTGINDSTRWKELLAGTEVENDVLTILRECIEHATPDNANRLANLILHYQVMRSRTVGRDVSFSNRFSDDAAQTVNWAILNCLISDCFRYARNLEPNIPLRISNRAFEPAGPRLWPMESDSPLLQALAKANDPNNNPEFAWER